MMDTTARQLVEHLGMKPLPVEATFFVSTYRSEADTESGGPVGTAMLGLYCDDPLAGQLVQVVIPAGVWQAGELVGEGRWALFGCTMAPGFTGTCFEGGRISDLLASYPDRGADIRRLGIPDDHVTRMPAGFAT